MTVLEHRGAYFFTMQHNIDPYSIVLYTNKGKGFENCKLDIRVLLYYFASNNLGKFIPKITLNKGRIIYTENIIQFVRTLTV